MFLERCTCLKGALRAVDVATCPWPLRAAQAVPRAQYLNLLPEDFLESRLALPPAVLAGCARKLMLLERPSAKDFVGIAVLIPLLPLSSRSQLSG